MKLEQLPRYFKWVALIITLLAITFAIIAKTGALDISKEFTKIFTKVAIILAGYIFIISKEKIEDEFILTIRLRSIAYAFLSGIMVYIINQIAFQSSVSQDPFFYFFNMMFMYIFIFYLSKYGVLKIEK